jgi:hypothetical protein
MDFHGVTQPLQYNYGIISIRIMSLPSNRLLPIILLHFRFMPCNAAGECVARQIRRDRENNDINLSICLFP